MSLPVTLQISLAPSDFAHAQHLLPHQCRTWRSQVAEILLTIDTHRSAGRFSARWEEGRDKIGPLAQSIPGARVVEVDYGPEAKRRVADKFAGGRLIAAKDYRGGPSYSYFFALDAATHPLVLHADSDMFFGGGSGTWIAEAREKMQSRPEILFAAPLPGAPAADGSLRYLRAQRRAGFPPAYDFDDMSTRLFLVDRDRLARELTGARFIRPGIKKRIQAWIDGNPAAELPEVIIGRHMQARGLVRHEFLGAEPGTWSLHPPYRSPDFYRRLPELITRVEQGGLPEAQRGDHDLNGSMVDWAEGIAHMRRNRWWRRLAARFFG